MDVNTAYFKKKNSLQGQTSRKQTKAFDEKHWISVIIIIVFTLRYKWDSRFNYNNLKTVQKVHYLSSLASLLQVSPRLHLSVRWSMGGADSLSSTTPLITESWTHLSSPRPWHQALLRAVIYQQNVNHNALSDEKLKGRNGARDERSSSGCMPKIS